MDGLGSINWWGFTPALDLQLEIDDNGSLGEERSGHWDATGALVLLSYLSTVGQCLCS
jgi:hypothetical protein